MKQFVRYNRIWLPLAILLTVLLSVLSMRGLTVQALALEQEARCGIEEHLHTQDCYEGDKLVCSKHVHTHTENCYLILLKDNDINSLLIEIEKQKDNNLEAMIGRAVDNALMFNRNLTSPMETAPEAATDVAAINDTIETYGIQPRVTLNENLYKSTSGYDGELPLQQQTNSSLSSGYNTLDGNQTIPADPLSQSWSTGQQIPTDPLSQGAMMMAAPQDPLAGGSTYAVGDGATTGNNVVNYYIHLDGEWVFAARGNSTVNNSKPYYSRISVNNVLNSYNGAIDTDLSAGDLDLQYSSNDNFTGVADAETVSTGYSSYIYFGREYNSRNDARATKYVRLMDGDKPMEFYTVRFRYQNGTETVRYIRSGENTVLPGDADWKQGDTSYNGGDSVPIDGITTFVEWPSYTVIFDYIEETKRDVTKTVPEGESVTLPDDTDWVYNGEKFTGGTEVTVNGDMTFVEDSSLYARVTFRYLDGRSTIQTVRIGETVTLPSGTDWLVGETEYMGGTSVQVERTVTFTEKPRVYINYNVNFITPGGVTFRETPTLLGSTLQEITDTVLLNTDGRIRNVSNQEVIGKVNNNSVGLSRVAGFQGWQIEGTDIILSPNSTLTWPELLSYAGDDYTIDLLGVWHTRAQQTASFYIRYDSVAVDINGNITSQDSNLYTPELYAAFVGGTDAATLSTSGLAKYHIADTTADNSYTADQNIRKLYGQTGDIWLQSFPRDEDVFELLKNYARDLRVDGDPVNVNDLNEKAYAIRWYVFKCQDDAWHIDGKLVKKEGSLDVTKTFAGNLEAIEAAKQSFRMEARNAAGDKQYYLYLSQPAQRPQNGTVLLPSESDGSTYLWTIDGVRYGEQWTITEMPEANDSNIIVHSEYRVVDAENLQNKSGSGTQVEVSGMTYATDMPEVEALRIEFTNIYHDTDSVIIKKADDATGQPLGGAVFGLMQNGEPLRFTYDAVNDRYTYDPNGTVTELTGNGYYELLIEGFRYENGPVEVQELVAPEGYTPVESILIGYREDGTIGLLSETDMADFNNGLLTVRNSTDSTSVTVTKLWRCPAEEWQPVTVQLLANDLPVTTVIPGVEPSVQLNADNGYSATWTDLPVYANGQEIRWSVRETKIGNENCLSDFTFVNWLVEYGYPSYTYDGEGRLANTSFTITNDTKRTMLRLIKTNLGGGIRLEGATFTLERLVDGELDPNFIVRTQTTGSDGTLTFDNLKFGDYRLTELKPPTGYVAIEEAAYLTVHEDGRVEVQGHPMVMPGATAFSVQVLNEPERPLPLTGGEGTGGYTMPGLLLMTAAVLGYALPRKRKRGGADPTG